MLIQVTENDIKYGAKGSCRFCPIALAVSRVLDSKYSVTVSTVVCIRQLILACERLILPNEAHKFITDFDNDNKVEPFEFELEIPQRYMRN